MDINRLWENRDFELLRDSFNAEQKKSRHNIRYACFRIQKYEIEGSPEPEKEHLQIKKTVEEVQGFDGWKNFAVTWDIAEPNPIRIVKRKWSIHQEWNAVLLRVVPELPVEAKKIDTEIKTAVSEEKTPPIRRRRWQRK